MICPLCQQNNLLQAESRWYCPQCYHVYPYLPTYGPKLYELKNFLSPSSWYQD
jgi:hypothetical protein